MLTQKCVDCEHLWDNCWLPSVYVQRAVMLARTDEVRQMLVRVAGRAPLRLRARGPRRSERLDEGRLRLRRPLLDASACGWGDWRE